MDNVKSHDYLNVFDGKSVKQSNLLSKISGSYHDGFTVFPSNISSSSNKLLVTFTSDEWYQRNGFKAKIFVESSKGLNLSADDCSATNPCHAQQGHCQSDDECIGDLKCGQNNCPANHGYHQQTRCCYDYCSQWLDMENGTLTSPWYPDSYPLNMRCHTLITVGMTVAGPRTITLEFLYFKVRDLLALFMCPLIIVNLLPLRFKKAMTW